MSNLEKIKLLTKQFESSDNYIKENAKDIAQAICNLCNAICLENDNEGDKFSEWEEKIGELKCEMLGSHTWIYDQCGYWGHQYCVDCRTHKYPELGNLKCDEATQITKGSSEKEYNKGCLGFVWE